MTNDKTQTVLNCTVGDNLTFTVDSSSYDIGSTTSAGTPISCWHYWTDDYYPQVIYTSYPVYMQEKAKDKGRQAFELIKMLKDKRFINIEKVGDFINLMDELIKIL